MEQTKIKKNFGKILMELRVQKGYTQEQLAEKLNLSTHTINRIEMGHAFVSCEVLSQICKLFDISPCVLFTPKSHLLYDEHTNYLKEIIRILPKFTVNRLKELYNYLVMLDE